MLEHPWLSKTPKKTRVFTQKQVVAILKQSVYPDVFLTEREGVVDKQEHIENLDFTMRYLESTLNEYMRNITEK